MGIVPRRMRCEISCCSNSAIVRKKLRLARFENIRGREELCHSLKIRSMA